MKTYVNVPAKSNKQKKTYFCYHQVAAEEGSGSESLRQLYPTDSRIQIRTKMSQIHNTGISIGLQNS
jgi:hypothetical protein